MYSLYFRDKILTGSFDKTSRLWSTASGDCLQAFWGHTAEVVAVQFDPQKHLVCTASLDTTARLFNAATGSEFIYTVNGYRNLYTISAVIQNLHLVTEYKKKCFSMPVNVLFCLNSVRC